LPLFIMKPYLMFLSYALRGNVPESENN